MLYTRYVMSRTWVSVFVPGLECLQIQWAPRVPRNCLPIIAGSSSFLVQTEAPKGEKSSDFSKIETMLTRFL